MRRLLGSTLGFIGALSAMGVPPALGQPIVNEGVAPSTLPEGAPDTEASPPKADKPGAQASPARDAQAAEDKPALSPESPEAPANTGTPEPLKALPGSPTSTPLAPWEETLRGAPDPAQARSSNASPPLPPPPPVQSPATGSGGGQAATAADGGDERTSAVSARTMPSWSVWLGYQGRNTATAAFDIFAEDDLVSHAALGVGVALSDLGEAQIALVALADRGSTTAEYRGMPTELKRLTFALGPEIRFPVLPGMVLLGRVQPTLAHVDTSLEDTGSAVRLSQSEWKVGAEAALGVTVNIAAPHAKALQRPFGVFVRGEVGYSWLSEVELDLKASGSGAPVRTETLSLGPLPLHGASFSLALGLGY